MWSKQVPKSLRANLRYRSKILSLCNSESSRRAIKKACAEDLLFYVNTFVWQLDPTKVGHEVGPFICWDFQEKAFEKMVWAVDHQKDLVIEKSREMGASWMCLILFEWLWHFRSYKQFLVVSRSADAVDHFSSNSLFWKIDFIHKHQPTWMVPRKERRDNYFGNEDNGSTINGEASTAFAGTGGRATAMFIDEFSMIRDAHELLQRTSDTSDCRIFNGTHRGTESAFNTICQSGAYRKLQLHWSQHPDKRPGLYEYNSRDNKVVVHDKTYSFPTDFQFVMQEVPAGGPFPCLRSPWYDEQCARKISPRAVAMDLDIDPGGSVAQFFNSVTIRQLRNAFACDPYWQGDIHYDRDTGKPQGLVEVPDGPLKLWIRPDKDGKIPPSQYCAGADISTGVGATESVLSIGDARKGEKVLEYATPFMTPEMFAPLAVALCWLFKDENGEPAYFAWEVAGPGGTFGNRVIELRYPNMHYRKSEQNKLSGKISRVPGWYPTVTAKRELLEEYRAALDRRQFVNRSDKALEECLPYKYVESGHIEHPLERESDDPTKARCNHGDRVIADALVQMGIKMAGLMRTKGAEKDKLVVGSLAWRMQIHENAKRQSDEWASPAINW